MDKDKITSYGIYNTNFSNSFKSLIHINKWIKLYKIKGISAVDRIKYHFF